MMPNQRAAANGLSAVRSSVAGIRERAPIKGPNHRLAGHAFCLMNNQFHLVVETPEANLVEGMRWLLSTYTIRLNHRHKLFGHVFSGRYKALWVEGGNGYLKSACDSVHLNPVRAGLIRGQNGDGGAAAGGDDADHQGDCRPAALGNLQERPHTTALLDARRAADPWSGGGIMKNEPLCSDPFS